MSSTRVLTRRAYGTSPQVAISTSKRTHLCTQIRCVSQTTKLCTSSNSSQPSEPPSFQKVFASPTWSVRALLPSSTSSSSSTPSPQNTITRTTTTTPAIEITPKTLHHLLRLSSLPPPTTPQEESALLNTLHTQLHFVRAIQAVDTTGIEPLTSIRDESSAGSTTNAVTLDNLKEALASETVVGFRGRPRRIREENGRRERSAEEVIVEEKTRSRRERGYYVVESGKVKGGE